MCAVCRYGLRGLETHLKAHKKHKYCLRVRLASAEDRGSVSARKSVVDNGDTRDLGISRPSLCKGHTFVSASRLDDGTLSDTQHSRDRSFVMHEDVECEEETELKEGESVHDTMNVTQRSRSVAVVRSRSPSISPSLV